MRYKCVPGRSGEPAIVLEVVVNPDTRSRLNSVVENLSSN